MTIPLITNNTQTFDLIRQWASDRNLILGATPQAQFVKLVEEFSEVTTGMEEQNYAEIKDGLGDTAVVLTILAAQMGTSIEECFQFAKDQNRSLVRFDDEPEYATIIRCIITQIGRVATGIAKKNMPIAMEGLGHTLGLVNILSEILLVDEGFDEALSASYNVIKDRKGQMIDGVFVKEADLHLVGGV